MVKIKNAKRGRCTAKTTLVQSMQIVNLDFWRFLFHKASSGPWMARQIASKISEQFECVSKTALLLTHQDARGRTPRASLSISLNELPGGKPLVDACGLSFSAPPPLPGCVWTWLMGCLSLTKGKTVDYHACELERRNIFRGIGEKSPFVRWIQAPGLDQDLLNRQNRSPRV